MPLPFNILVGETIVTFRLNLVINNKIPLGQVADKLCECLKFNIVKIYGDVIALSFYLSGVCCFFWKALFLFEGQAMAVLTGCLSDLVLMLRPDLQMFWQVL